MAQYTYSSTYIRDRLMLCKFDAFPLVKCSEISVVDGITSYGKRDIVNNLLIMAQDCSHFHNSNSLINLRDSDEWILWALYYPNLW